MISLTGDNDDFGGGISIPVPDGIPSPISDGDDDFQTPPESASILTLKQEWVIVIFIKRIPYIKNACIRLELRNAKIVISFVKNLLKIVS